jgi:hypothetical protein
LVAVWMQIGWKQLKLWAQWNQLTSTSRNNGHNESLYTVWKESLMIRSQTLYPLSYGCSAPNYSAEKISHLFVPQFITSPFVKVVPQPRSETPELF